MDLLLPLISLILIAGGDSQHARFIDAAMTTSPNSRSLTLTKNWEAVLPKTPMPPAISDLIAQQDDDITIGSNDLKFVKGLRKIRPGYGRGKLEDDNGDKHVHIASEVEYGLKELSESEHEGDPKRLTMSYEPELEEGPDKLTMSYGSQHEEDPEKLTMSYGSQYEEDPDKLTMSYGSEHEDDREKVAMSYGSEH
ncbi:uncharacterized protein LOC119287836 [Triticum dicoccoides]|uniref:uncharacterized protein LOC119287836 n=1 Tax=Triticum dicoccoides TaxID=85692 RepID=UPI001890204B|nr:uncharacterized protein LOC119287836 [Triticum dicoccoides]